MNTLKLIVACGILVSASQMASADLLIYGSAGDKPLAGQSLSDVRMGVNLSVAYDSHLKQNFATMTFTNVSVGLENASTAAFKEIVVNTLNNTLLWNPVILTSTPTVGYTISKQSNGLPNYAPQTKGFLELDAKNPPSKMGINTGELFKVKFSTRLSVGADISSYLTYLNTHESSEKYAIGFHAISCATVGGGSLAGIYQGYNGGGNVPEPGTLTLLGLGAADILFRKRRQANAV